MWGNRKEGKDLNIGKEGNGIDWEGKARLEEKERGRKKDGKGGEEKEMN